MTKTSSWRSRSNVVVLHLVGAIGLVASGCGGSSAKAKPDTGVIAGSVDGGNPDTITHPIDGGADVFVPTDVFVPVTEAGNQPDVQPPIDVVPPTDVVHPTDVTPPTDVPTDTPILPPDGATPDTYVAPSEAGTVTGGTTGTGGTAAGGAGGSTGTGGAGAAGGTTGTGGTPTTAPSAPVASFPSTTIDFGLDDCGDTTGATQSLTVSNTGGGSVPLAVSARLAPGPASRSPPRLSPSPPGTVARSP